MTKARLVLEDGTVYEGEAFGATADAIGEVVFNTSLTGYQEIATDPSYRFQIVVMTYPHIGNYGVERAVEQSEAPQVAGFVVRDAVREPSNAHSQMPLGEYFERHRISAIAGIDTRALTRKIRNEGAMRGIITTDASRGVDSLVEEMRHEQNISNAADIAKVSAVNERFVCAKMAAAFDHTIPPGVSFAVLRIGPRYYARDPDQRRSTGVFTDSTCT